MPSKCVPFCGDGKLKGNEVCDDLNMIENDGCSLICEVEEGWKCTEIPSKCKTTCGDSIKAGLEECDDPKDPMCASNCTINKQSLEYKTT